LLSLSKEELSQPKNILLWANPLINRFFDEVPKVREKAESVFEVAKPILLPNLPEEISQVSSPKIGINT
jgi:hypothetical protein